ncbi:Histidine--tRNA ligase [Planctomycetes bacterium Poly30]|uniref:Histidine--tRNA ligase n=1 Tax=Saltatorellus ferox TaxID=2528018 RepID=A0A518EQE6_9BACT|nr:Histidine--tRNA ligase [Planctomycetes bacterium Poly30]
MSNKPTLIQPRTLRGFRDFTPNLMIPRERLIDTAKRVYRSFGFSPIDTPALEYTEILLGKGGDETDKQMYRFEDQGGRDVGMRFDLTIPFARFAAQHIGQLGTPFKRYHVGNVWRGEKAQRGRYREFIQCDFDTIGTTSRTSDVETGLVIYELFRALGFERFTIRINDRRLLSGVLDHLGLVERQTDVLRVLDKLGKVGPQKVTEELRDAVGLSEVQAADVLRFAGLSGSPAEILGEARELVGDSEIGAAGLEALAALFESVAAAGADVSRFALDPSIARGLDYYTGVIFETFLDDLPEIGSCCSGGRYDDLASLYTKEKLPGVGASLGVDRLLAAMEELKMIEETAAPCPVFLPLFEKGRDGDYLALAQELRAAGIGVEVYPEPKKLGAQLKYADRRGFPLALVVGSSEFSAGTVQVKDLKTGEKEDVARADLVSHLRQRI